MGCNCSKKKLQPIGKTVTKKVTPQQKNVVRNNKRMILRRSSR
jgi:hypothetical protein